VDPTTQAQGPQETQETQGTEKAQELPLCQRQLPWWNKPRIREVSGSRNWILFRRLAENEYVFQLRWILIYSNYISIYILYIYIYIILFLYMYDVTWKGAYIIPRTGDLVWPPNVPNLFLRASVCILVTVEATSGSVWHTECDFHSRFSQTKWHKWGTILKF